MAYLKKTWLLKVIVTVIFMLGYYGTLKITETNDEA